MNICLECGHCSNQGFWVGHLMLKDGTILHLKGKVTVNDNDGTFELDDLIHRVCNLYNADPELVDKIDGEAWCPECMSELYYPKG